MHMRSFVYLVAGIHSFVIWRKHLERSKKEYDKMRNMRNVKKPYLILLNHNLKNSWPFWFNIRQERSSLIFIWHANFWVMAMVKSKKLWNPIIRHKWLVKAGNFFLTESAYCLLTCIITIFLMWYGILSHAGWLHY